MNLNRETMKKLMLLIAFTILLPPGTGIRGQNRVRLFQPPVTGVLYLFLCGLARAKATEMRRSPLRLQSGDRTYSGTMGWGPGGRDQ